MIYANIKCVILIALEKERPPTPFSSAVSCTTLSALRSGDTRKINQNTTILVMITGVGPNNAKDGAQWVRTHIDPLFVFNFGSCGTEKRSIERGSSVNISEKVLPFMPGLQTHVPKTDIIDMESDVYFSCFKSQPFPFYCIKTVTDYNDTHLTTDFNEWIPTVQSEFRRLFYWVFPQTISGDDISVVIPTYNRSGYLPRCIDSVLNQTVLPKEIIVVDDGSTDTTNKILAPYNDSIKRMTLPCNKGVSYARNQGINHASGKWIMLLDSDDEWRPNKIESQVMYLNHHPYCFIVQSLDQWVRNGKAITQPTHLQKKSGWIFKESLDRCMISPSSVCFHRLLWDQYGPFNEDYPACEDYDLWLKITRHFPVGLDQTITLTRYAGHSDQLSSTVPILDQFRVDSLFKLYDSEQDFVIQAQIKTVLLKKLSILSNGFRKSLNK